MTDHTLQMLEFDKVRELLASNTSFPASRNLAAELRPSSDPDVVTRRLKESAEARHLLSIKPDLSVGQPIDVRDIAALAGIGKTLDVQGLLDVQTTLASARNLRTALSRLPDEVPSIWSIANKIQVFREIEDSISRCIAPNGDVLDSASEKLASVRRQLRDSRQTLLNRLQASLRSPRMVKFIQEPVITEREGRYVIPVKSEFRREVKGIIHDMSNTGATVFIEPWTTVELGNDLRQLTVEESQEIERILARLSGQIGEHAGAIGNDVELLAEIDLTLAKARYALSARCIEPMLSGTGGHDAGAPPDGRVIRLVNARHPLLKDNAVPLSLELGCDYSGLVITGPNTGGKTVALKTVGLLSLMTQAGIPIPCSEGTAVPIFDEIFADIGDEQSIEQTLSTFGWHMGNVVNIIGRATGHSLVLLDELGTSTDPAEGAALAKAILQHFLRTGATIVATTHFTDLKVFAHNTEGLKNASFDFDPVTLAPTYHLTVGIPGGSNAITTAARLGLPDTIISAAREMTSRGSQDIETLLQDLMREKQTASDLRASLERQSHENEALRSDLQARLMGLEEQERSLRHEIKDRLTREAGELEGLIRQAVSDLKKAKSKENIEKAEKALAEMQSRLSHHRWKTTAPIETVSNEAIRVGDRVRLTEAGVDGTALSAVDSENQIEVMIGDVRIRLGAGGVMRLEGGHPKETRRTHVDRRTSGKGAGATELDLRGKRAEEVQLYLDSYLNEAVLSNLSQVRIIHGFGGGTVRQIVRETLSTHPLVKSFRPGGAGEGGDGVTMASL